MGVKSNITPADINILIHYHAMTLTVMNLFHTMQLVVKFN